MVETTKLGVIIGTLIIGIVLISGCIDGGNKQEIPIGGVTPQEKWDTGLLTGEFWRGDGCHGTITLGYVRCTDDEIRKLYDNVFRMLYCMKVKKTQYKTENYAYCTFDEAEYLRYKEQPNRTKTGGFLTPTYYEYTNFVELKVIEKWENCNYLEHKKAAHVGNYKTLDEYCLAEYGLNAPSKLKDKWVLKLSEEEFMSLELYTRKTGAETCDVHVNNNSIQVNAGICNGYWGINCKEGEQLYNAKDEIKVKKGTKGDLTIVAYKQYIEDGTQSQWMLLKCPTDGYNDMNCSVVGV